MRSPNYAEKYPRSKRGIVSLIQSLQHFKISLIHASGGTRSYKEESRDSKMPLTNSSDPVVREILRIRDETHDEIRRLYIITGMLFVLLVIAVGTSLYIRSRDLSSIDRKAITEQVRTCFRSSQSRPELRSISTDPTLSDSVRGLVKAVYENTPTVKDCQNLATRLHTSIPKEFQ